MKFVLKYWSFIGGLWSVMILLLAYLGYLGFYTLFWTHFAILLLHQFEEYTFPGHFKSFYNQNVLNSNKFMIYPLNDTGILIVNIVLAWTFYLLGIILNYKVLWFSVGLLGITTLNGIVHVFMAIKLRRYNPGLISSIFLMIPFGIKYINEWGSKLYGVEFLFAFFIFVIGTALIPLGIRWSNSV